MAPDPSLMHACKGKEMVRTEIIITELAAKYRVSAVQVILAWHIGRGISAIPKSKNAERQKENINVRRNLTFCRKLLDARTRTASDIEYTRHRKHQCFGSQLKDQRRVGRDAARMDL